MTIGITGLPVEDNGLTMGYRRRSASVGCDDGVSPLLFICCILDARCDHVDCYIDQFPFSQIRCITYFFDSYYFRLLLFQTLTRL